MPKRKDIKKILIIGSGPIVIGQACEFDYSGVQALKTLKLEGYEVVLANSNPATIMTDPDLCDHTYIEPILPAYLEAIISKERPQAILPTMGGQTALNAAVSLAEKGILEKYQVELIGADLEVIKRAEDRELFRAAVTQAGLRVPHSGVVGSLEEAKKLAQEIGYPIIVRPSFTLGGAGGGVAEDEAALEEIVGLGLDLSFNHEVLIEESIIGWKELELEVLRDRNGRTVVVCAIENLDPMGVHTGDSITLAPTQTLSGADTQAFVEQALAAVAAVGMNQGGCNLQFAQDPKNGELVIIELNPRVSRSSALASKATGVPIAKVATKLAIGYTLDEVELDLTGEILGVSQPSVDYVVIKIPRFAFEKFPGSKDELTTSMRSVGETMAIGRSFAEALQKGLRSLEVKPQAIVCDPNLPQNVSSEELERYLKTPNSQRLYYLAAGFKQGLTVDEAFDLTWIDPWFLQEIKDLVDLEPELKSFNWKALMSQETEPGLQAGLAKKLRQWKEMGFSDKQLAWAAGTDEQTLADLRRRLDIKPVYKMVDACSGSVTARTPYYYSTYGSQEDELNIGQNKKIMILGGGPNRIGQGIEFDYCCVQAAYALQEAGLESVMVNSNPETVSTDYDTSTRLYFEPLTFEEVMNIINKEKPDGVIVQFGGQTPLNLALALSQAGVPILGTSPDSIDRAEDRERFTALIKKLGLTQPENGMALTTPEALKVAERIGYPVIVRPSYVLGGRAMRIIYQPGDLAEYVQEAEAVSPGRPILIDKFLEEAIEIDVDAVSDGEDTIIGGIIEQIEEGGIHSGDSSGMLPPRSLSPYMIEEITEAAKSLAKELKVIGLMNIQMAIKGRTLYILEVNPRASRTVPFVSKAVGYPLAKIATKAMLGIKLKDQNLPQEMKPMSLAVKESVLPFERFPGVDPILGPEMRSTGEVMGLASEFGQAFAKSQLAAGQILPLSGTIFISVRDEDKPGSVRIARILSDLGYNLMATKGTADFLQGHGLKVDTVAKVSEGHPHVIDALKSRQIDLVINTALGHRTVLDSESIRRTALLSKIPVITTLAGALTTAEALKSLKNSSLTVKSLQAYHKGEA